MRINGRLLRVGLFAGLALLPALARAQDGGALKVRVGDPVVNGSFIKPYKNLWRLTYTRPSGESIDAATWSDEVERLRLNGRTLLKRTQVAKYTRNDISMTTVNVFDPKTMAPVSRDFRDSRGPLKQIEFDGRAIKYRGTSAPGGELKEGAARLDVPVFDFYGGLWGLLLATFPLKEGFTASLPSLDESTETLRWATFRVARAETVEAGPGKRVKAWVVETEDNGPMTFWLTKEAPYVIKLVYVTPKGVTATYSMM
ncbi:MAG: hypothetical protein JOZ02_11440 [Acidobacteria bacterium]|nr:hypothetical protein [Acidobacteriota bacterium]